MPELPEVEALARYLGEQADGREVAGIDVVSFAVLKTYDPPPSALVGHVLERCSRRGKYLLLAVGPHNLVLHLARAGWVRWKDDLQMGPVGVAGAKWSARSTAGPPRQGTGGCPAGRFRRWRRDRGH